MSDFQVGDRVSVEGVVTAVQDVTAVGELVTVRLGPNEDYMIALSTERMTLIERPRRKLRVGSVWERRGQARGLFGRLYDRYVWTGQTFVSPNGDHYARETRDLDSNPELWREVPVEELAREADS